MFIQLVSNVWWFHWLINQKGMFGNILKDWLKTALKNYVEPNQLNPPLPCLRAYRGHQVPQRTFKYLHSQSFTNYKLNLRYESPFFFVVIQHQQNSSSFLFPVFIFFYSLFQIQAATCKNVKRKRFKGLSITYHTHDYYIYFLPEDSRKSYIMSPLSFNALG